MFNNITEIKSKALKITDGMKILNKKGEHITTVILDHPEKCTKTFSLFLGAYSFTDENGIYYAIPAVDGVEDIFLMSGYTEKNYPCSLNLSTNEPSGAWAQLCAEFCSQLCALA